MTAPILSIVIPTYNRAELLRYLLNSICEDFSEWPSDLQLVVVDNSSTDHTAAVIGSFLQRGFPIKAVRQSENIGMDGNLAACFDLAEGKYFWQLGDDELLYKGTAAYVLELCRTRDFGLLHIESHGFAEGQQAAEYARPLPASIHCVPVDSGHMIRRANVYLTFISANVVNRSVLLEKGQFDARSELRSNVPQLAWICDVLKLQNTHLHVTTPLFGALHGNTGGYKLIEVFCLNFVGIVRKRLGVSFPSAGRIAANAALLRLLPFELIAQQRRPPGSNPFIPENARVELDRIYQGNAYYRILVRPLLEGSRSKRRAILFITRLFNRVNRSLDFRLL